MSTSDIKETHIVMFSGGKDSTAMLFMMLEKNMQIDKIINVDTTKEFPELYEHIELVKEKLLEYTDVPITTVTMDFDYWMIDREISRGERTGQHGYGWASIHSRWCTGLKTQALFKASFDLPYNPRQSYYIGITPYREANAIIYYGIASDEIKRLHRKRDPWVRQPLVKWNVTEKDALQYCYSLGFDWGGLYNYVDRVSCYLCPLQGKKELRWLYNNRPELWKKMKELDVKSYNEFRHDMTLDDLENLFIEENKFRDSIK